MQLSRRLETILNMAGRGETVADIGTDHGYVPLELVRRGQYRRAIAMDVRKGPLERAREHISQAGLADRIETRLSNGFDRLLPGEADTVVIAGMGGPLMAELLERGKTVVGESLRMILSPQSEVGEFHRYILDNEYEVVEEVWIEDENKFYVVMEVHPGAALGTGIPDGTMPETAPGTEAPDAPSPEMAPWSPEELCYGRLPLQRGSAVLEKLLEKEIRTAETVLAQLAGRNSDSAVARRGEMEEKRQLAEAAMQRVLAVGKERRGT